MFTKLKFMGGPVAGLVTVLLAAILVQAPVWAGGVNDVLEKRIEALEKELKEVRALLKKQQQTSATKQEVEVVKQDVAKVSDVHSEWKDSESVVHLAGYGDATFVDPEGGDSRFEASFQPIFHYMFNDKFMMESELEITVDSEGETDVALEYAALDWFLHDNATLVAGKFLSPIGQFRQNLHPSWINKLPTAPIGFGHGGAAPLADIGVQMRGGFKAGNTDMNYAVFVSNGPELVADAHGEGGDDDHGGAIAPARAIAQADGEHAAEDEHAEEGEHADADAEHAGEADEHADEIAAAELETEGRVQDPGGNKVFGGRFGVRPIPNLEIGASAGFGQVPVTGSGQIPGEPERDYRVLGVDVAFQQGSALDVRGEWVQQKVDADAVSAMFPGEMTWEAWYLQGAYKFLPTKFEGVLRYGEFDTPASRQKQWAFGVNYLIANNIIAKLSFESNKDLADRLLMQLAYGY